MKTLKLPQIFTLIITMIFFSSCGKKNESGKKSSSSKSTSGVLNFGSTFQNGVVGASPAIQQLIASTPCAIGNGGNQRVTSQVPITSNGGAYVGVTSVGDVAEIVSSAPGQSVLRMYLCMRTSFMMNNFNYGNNQQLSNQQVTAQLTQGYPVLMPINNCQVGFMLVDLVLNGTTQLFFRQPTQSRGC